MDLVFFDIESTSLDVFHAEIIEAYFLDSFGLEYYMKSQVDSWHEDAEEIHKISYEQMLTYPDKLKAHQDCYNFIKNYTNYTWICFSNPNNKYGTIYYDKGVLINSLLECDIDFKIDKIVSVYDMAKEAYELNLFKPIKGKKGRISFSQENVYKAIFDKTYNAHNAKADVIAMKEIYQVLEKALREKSPINESQNLTLI